MWDEEKVRQCALALQSPVQGTAGAPRVTGSTAGLSLHPYAISYFICAAGHTTELPMIPNRSNSAVRTGPLAERIKRQLQAGSVADASFMSLHLMGAVGKE